MIFIHFLFDAPHGCDALLGRAIFHHLRCHALGQSPTLRWRGWMKMGRDEDLYPPIFVYFLVGKS